MNRPFVFTILDGWGYTAGELGNPIQKAHKPTMDYLQSHFPVALLQASGLAVGLQWNEVGNSETGHLNLGAGRIVLQYQTRIQHAIKDGSFLKNEALLGAFNYAKEHGSNVHCLGLLTSGSVHADFSHMVVLFDVAASAGAQNIYFHFFLDGKDSGQKEGLELYNRIVQEIASRGFGTILTMMGRNFPMDRDNHWDLTQQAHELIVHAAGEKTADFGSAIAHYYEQNVYDTLIPPLAHESYTGLQDNDALIFFNFREDSVRQIFRSFVDPNFSQFPRQLPRSLYVTSMTQYCPEFPTPVAFMPPDVKNCLAEFMSGKGLAQLHIAETVKYAHVTFFFNGIKHDPYPEENDELIPSVKSPEQEPAMSAMNIAKRVVAALDEQKYDLIVINFANADILAHTGNYDATLKGIEALDEAVCLVKDAVLNHDGLMVITADHGNAESLYYSGTGEPETKHDGSPVPFILIGKEFERQKTAAQLLAEVAEIRGVLGDVAPTVLELMGLPKPPEMTGKSLLPLLK